MFLSGKERDLMKDSWDVRLFQTKTGKLEEVSGENERSSQG